MGKWEILVEHLYTLFYLYYIYLHILSYIYILFIVYSSAYSTLLEFEYK